jgi:serine protease AprX
MTVQEDKMALLAYFAPRRVALALALSLLLVTGAAITPAAAPAPAALETAPGLDPGLSLVGTAVQKVIVTGRGALAALVERHGGRVTSMLPLVHGVAADVPADRLGALVAEGGVTAVTADRTAFFEEYTYDETTTASNFARTAGATQAWADGNFGAGIGVAVLDTGVSPQNDFAGRLIHGPDLSGEGTTIDNYGHGTVMAGIIAGSGADSMNRSGGSFTGVAPAAHVVAVKAAGRNGVVDVSTMLQAMHWISAYRTQYNIRVLNLAWGVHSTQDPSVDPLNYAVQRLWREGIVVVVAAGNSGPNAGTITKPGDDPVVLTVGAMNDQGDADPSNDNVPQWSSRGPTAAGLTKPDLVAPGRTIISQRALGSHVEEAYPRATMAPSYIKGSGTSQASAVASGVVALLLAARPELTPDQVKALLVSTAAPLPTGDANRQGAGRLRYHVAVATPAPEATQELTATGLGSIEASRGGVNVVAMCNDEPTVIAGEIDVQCEAWDPEAWTASDWTGEAWTGVSWKGADWTGVSWKNIAWSDAVWTGVSWKGGTWTSDSWMGSSWTGTATPESAWTGVSWKDSAWTGVSWKEGTWTTGDWTSGSYDEFLTAWWGASPPPGVQIPGEPFTPRGRRPDGAPFLPASAATSMP